MKLFMKLLLTLLVLAVLAPFTILKDNSGRPLMSFSDLRVPDMGVSDIKEVAEELPSVSGEQDVVYQWKDDSGNLNFTTEPPPQGVEYTMKSFDARTNVIQAVKPKADSEVEAQQAAGGLSSDQDGGQGNGIGNPYTPEKIEKLFDDAKAVQEKLNDRFKEQQQIIDKL